MTINEFATTYKKKKAQFATYLQIFVFVLLISLIDLLCISVVYRKLTGDGDCYLSYYADQSILLQEGYVYTTQGRVSEG